MESIWVWATMIALWLVITLFYARKDKGAVLLRRALFLLVGLAGIVLLVIKPERYITTNASVVRIVTSEAVLPKKNVQTFNNVHDFLNDDRAADTDTVHIYGDGLNSEDLDLLTYYNLKYFPSDTITGITDITLPDITEKQDWVLTGTVQGPDIEKIELSDPGKKKSIARISNSKFEIRSKAPVAGNYLIELNVLKTSGDTIQELLPITVKPQSKWNILVLSSYPSFENNYLKNYWTRIGNGFTVRSKIARDRFQTSFINTPDRNLDNLSTSEISDYKFIITDIASWNDLNQGEQFRILDAVRNNGLALLFRINDVKESAENVRHPKFIGASEINWNTSRDDISIIKNTFTSSWNTIRQQGHIIGRYTSLGLGHLCVLGLEDTYKLILSSASDAYQNIWAEIFSNVYREFRTSAQLLFSEWVWEGEKTHFQILTNGELENTPILNDSIPLPYLETPFVDGSIEVDLWAAGGYNSIRLSENEKVLNFYAHPKGSWAAMKQNQLFTVNSRLNDAPHVSTKGFNRRTSEIPFFWWLLMMFLGFGALWLDERVVG